MVRALAILSISAAALAASTAAFAEPVQIGVLECAGGPSVGYVIGSNAALNCVFRPSTRRGDEGYVGSMKSHRPRRRRHNRHGIGLAGLRAVEKCFTRRTRRLLRRGVRQCIRRRRRRSQCAGRRTQQFHHAPAGQRTGPDRPQSRRHGEQRGIASGARCRREDDKALKKEKELIFSAQERPRGGRPAAMRSTKGDLPIALAS